MLTALAGGVGAARFLDGLVAVVPPEDVTAVVNTGDDDEFHGLWVCPDLDSVTYRLARARNAATGITVRSEEPGCETEELAMQEWFVHRRSEPPVVSVRFEGAEAARPAPGV